MVSNIVSQTGIDVEVAHMRFDDFILVVGECYNLEKALKHVAFGGI
jgi:hypothetical protein